jgi:hypothetical protein
MSPESEEVTTQRKPHVGLLYRVMLFLAALVVARFVLEVAGVPHSATRYLSSTAGLFLAAIYVAALAPLRGGMKKFRQLLLPALLLSAWTAGWVVVATLVSGIFRLERSHFALPSDYGNWGHLGHHVLEHVLEIGVFFVLVVILMGITHFLWRWPVIVGPGALLGALVIMRYWVEAMGLEAWRAAAWSSTVGVMLAAFYLGGMGPRVGRSTAMQLLIPSLILGWVWRFWVFLATVMSAAIPFYRTHFFDPTGGHVLARLAGFLVFGVVVEGFVAGLIVWWIAVWIARATRPVATA